MSVSGLDSGASRVEAAKLQQNNDAIIQLAAKAESVDSVVMQAAIGSGEAAKAALAEGIGGLVDVSA